jgi:hypothetical protein
MEFNIDDQVKRDLLELKPLIQHQNRAYSSVEQDKLYALFNKIYSQKKTPNGCGSCLRSTLTSLKKALAIIEPGV